TAMIADTDAYCAAIFYHLRQYDKMHEYWNAFLDIYSHLISKGDQFDQQEAIDWLLKLNPHRYKTNLEEFLRFISKGSFLEYPVQKSAPQEIVEPEYSCVKEKGTWNFSFDGSTIQAPEVKGFYDIQKMLMQP